jgi:protein Mpv17
MLRVSTEYSAPFGLACFVGAMGFMEGRTVEGVQTKFKEVSLSPHIRVMKTLISSPPDSQMYIPAILANWQLWPLVQTINFRYMPLRYRVPFTGAVGIAWQVFLSILNSTKRVAVDEKEAIKA